MNPQYVQKNIYDYLNLTEWLNAEPGAEHSDSELNPLYVLKNIYMIMNLYDYLNRMAQLT